MTLQLDFLATKASFGLVRWNSLALGDKWIYYILRELHWWSSVVWATAVINGNMNFADTLYWLQIATTTASNYSSHNSLSLVFFFPLLTFPLSNTDHPDLKLSMFLSVSLHYRKSFSKMRSAAATHYITASPHYTGLGYFDEWNSLHTWNTSMIVSWFKN